MLTHVQSDNIEPGSLHRKTLELLKEKDVPAITLHDKTGLSYYWIKKFSSGSIKDPSVNKVQKLYEFLTGQKLEV